MRAAGLALAAALAPWGAGPCAAQPAAPAVAAQEVAATTPEPASATQPALPSQQVPATPPTPPPAPPEPTPPHIDRPGPELGPLPSETDVAYDNRIRASVAAAQGLQGPLDGRWFLYGPDGRRIYIFQLVDPPGGGGPLEGVWRDLRRPPGSFAYGVIGMLYREGVSLTAAFASSGGASVRLQGRADGTWEGELTENGAKVAVVLKRY